MRHLLNLFQNLSIGVRLCLPWPLKRPRSYATLGQFIILIIVLWLVSLAEDLINTGLPADYSPWGVLSRAAIHYFWLGILAVIVVLDRRPSIYLSVAVPMASALIVLAGVWIAVSHAWFALAPESFASHYTTLWRSFLLLEMLVFARICYKLNHIFAPRSIGYALLYGSVVYAVLTYLPHRPLVIERRHDAYTPAKLDVEAIYYAQTNLLRHRLHAIAPGKSGVVDVYFIGFAAYAKQNVFRREVEQATDIIERQYNAEHHSVKLINNLGTTGSAPLANRHNLDKTVRALAEKMNDDEDVAVLFLSSHGAENATIAVDFPRFELNDISADDVLSIFDEHRIKWRVIIVSACYSGSFIDSLASPTTLVITAAAADRSSFGCAHKNDWTYFGQAYFSQALAEQASFIDAFNTARTLLEKRESDENKTASLPQISAGDEISRYLRQHNL